MRIGPHTFSLLDSHAFDYEVKFYVGPAFDYVDATEFAVGGAFDTSAETTLTDAMDNLDTQAKVADASAFRSTGGAYIIANGDDETDEFITYESKTSTTLDDLTRSFWGYGQGGVHSSGATVKQWLEVTQYFTGMSLDWQRSGNTVTWSVPLTGLHFNSALFQQDHTLVAMYRMYPADDDGGWSEWTLLFAGSIVGQSPQDRYHGDGPFSLKVEGPQAYLRLKEIPAHQFGRVNLAENRPVTVSSTLSDVMLEANSGEFTGAPSVAASNVNDGQMSTLWISDTVPDVTVEGTGDTDVFDLLITEIYPRHVVGTDPADYQWFEIIWGETGGMTLGYQIWSIYTSKTGWPGLQPFKRNEHGAPSPDPGEIWVFCSNREKFEETFPTAEYSRIVNLGQQLFDPDGDWLVITMKRGWNEDGGWGHGYSGHDVVVWGDATYPHMGGNWWPSNDMWGGAAVALPDRTHSIHRTPTLSTDTDTSADWTEAEYPLPGRHSAATAEYVSIELPAMTAVLAAELAIDEEDQAELTNLDGFTASGRVQIDTEWIDYESLDADNNYLVGLTRGVDETDPAVHSVDTPVYQVEDGVYTDCRRISTYRWRRRRVYDDNGVLVVPEDFSLWVSTEESPAYPSSGNPGEDWTRLCIAHGRKQAEFVHEFEPVRARHVLLFIREMSDGGRAKVNEIEIYEATVTVSDDDELKDYSNVGTIVEHILETHVGISASKINIETTVPFLEWTTSTSKATSLLDDLARRSNCVLICELDGSLTWTHDPTYPMYGFPDAVAELSKASVIAPSFRFPYGRETSQVIVYGKDAQTGEVHTGTYPPTADSLGSPYKVEEIVVSSAREAQMLAEAMYRRMRAPLEGTLELVGNGEDAGNGYPLIKPSSRVVFTWLMDEFGEYFNQKNLIVEGIHLSAEFGSPGGDDKSWDVSLQVSGYI